MQTLPQVRAPPLPSSPSPFASGRILTAQAGALSPSPCEICSPSPVFRSRSAEIALRFSSKFYVLQMETSPTCSRRHETRGRWAALGGHPHRSRGALGSPSHRVSFRPGAEGLQSVASGDRAAPGPGGCRDTTPDPRAGETLGTRKRPPNKQVLGGRGRNSHPQSPWPPHPHLSRGGGAGRGGSHRASSSHLRAPGGRVPQSRLSQPLGHLGPGESLLGGQCGMWRGVYQPPPLEV